jgi:hypothetical protein
MMKTRRQFIKRGALFVPMIFVPKLIRAQPILSGLLNAQPVVAAGASCAAGISQTSNDGDGIIYAALDTNRYQGQRDWSNASARNICQIDFMLSLGAGTITGLTFVARIWTMSGTSLDANVASSSGVSGSQGWSASWVSFAFSSPYTTTGGTNYGITIDDGGTSSGSNYAVVRKNSTTGGLAGDYEKWNAAKSFQIGSGGPDIAIKIYWQ